MSRINRISIARLHNRGNYEHSRYEVTVEPQQHEDPGRVFRELEDVLDALDPQTPTIGFWPVATYRKRLAEYTAKRAAGVALDEREQQETEEATRAVARWDEWQAARDAALARFSALGGAERHTDAKLGWDQDDDEEAE